MLDLRAGVLRREAEWASPAGQVVRLSSIRLVSFVHRAVAADFFGTGRPAVVAVSFLPHDKFPERVTRKADALVVFEQTARGEFVRHPLQAIECDAVVCVVGDVYGTGRKDIVVGNFSRLTSDHPVTIWRNTGPRR